MQAYLLALIHLAIVTEAWMCGKNRQHFEPARHAYDLATADLLDWTDTDLAQEIWEDWQDLNTELERLTARFKVRS